MSTLNARAALKEASGDYVKPSHFSTMFRSNKRPNPESDSTPSTYVQSHVLELGQMPSEKSSGPQEDGHSHGITITKVVETMPDPEPNAIAV